jgi:tetratricopeptide (TPR) repeat protein
VRGFAVPTAKFPDHHEGLRWLDAEHVNLLYAVETAAATDNPREAVRLALGLADYLRLRHLHVEAAWVAGVAEQVAQTPFERAQLLDNRGNALMAVGMFDEAIALHEQALELFREQGEEEGAAIALMSIGVTLRNAGRPEEAVTRHRQARAIFQRVGPPYYVAAVWNNLAYAWLDSGNFDQALRAAEKAVAIFQTLGNVVGAMRALSIRSSVLLRLQRHQEALEAARLAVVCAVKARKAPTELGQLLLASAEAALAAGRSWDESRATLEAAAAAFDEGGWQDIGDKIRRVADRTAAGGK